MLSGCVAGGNSINFKLDENTRPQGYSRITDPTATFEEKVHRFQITSVCAAFKEQTR